MLRGRDSCLLRRPGLVPRNIMGSDLPCQVPVEDNSSGTWARGLHRKAGSGLVVQCQVPALSFHRCRVHGSSSLRLVPFPPLGSVRGFI
jgi:hypothetical protein